MANSKLVHRLSFSEKALFALAGILVFGLISIQFVIPARLNAQVSASEAVASQPGESGLRFEVASVKRSDPNSRAPGRPPTYSSGRYACEKVLFFGIAWDAYGIKEDYQIEAAFPWMRAERYDIAAKVPEGATVDQAHIMLQHLLAERFGLVVRHETRQLPGYRLVVAKGGARLKRSVEAATIEVGSPSSAVMKNGVRQFADNAKSGMLFTVESEQIHGRKETTGRLAHYLGQALHTPVIDATGIEGQYDYDLTFAPPEHGPPAKGDVFMPVVPPAGPNTPAQASPSALSNYPTVFDVVRKELGLQLEPDKSIPIDVLVLDKANPNPTEN